MSTPIRNDDIILFQGDSITDSGRVSTADGLGNGYVAMIRGLLTATRPELKVTFRNRGISGNLTTELLQRWQPDCLDLKPNLLSIMIGVNDVWRKIQPDSPQKHVPLPEFKINLTSLVDQALAGGVRTLVLMSPTSIEKENDGELNRMLADYAGFVRELAAARHAIYVPARENLLRARQEQPEINWTSDGCHPGPAGHALLAQTWLQAVVGV